jgi:hypothetical protein
MGYVLREASQIMLSVLRQGGICLSTVTPIGCGFEAECENAMIYTESAG